MVKQVPVSTVNRAVGWFSVATARDDIIPAKRRIECRPHIAVALNGGTISWKPCSDGFATRKRGARCGS
jgi:hypothetical protein